MQASYAGYQPYPAQAPYVGQYYTPATPYANGYPNGGAYPDPAAGYQIWQNTPQLAPIAGQTPMARSGQLWEPQMPQRQPSNAGGTPMPRPKTLTTKTKPPLKSAMKQPHRSASEPIGYIHRPRTNSDPHGTLKQFSRPRTNSNTARDIPDHLFLSIVGTNELRIQNVKMHLLTELKQMISTLWPHGIETESVGANHSWRVMLARTPWSSVGTDAIMVLRMINQFFTRINLYYDFVNSVNTGQHPPRLVFVETKDPGIWINHFVGYFSRNGRKLTLVDPPPQVGTGIGPRLRLAWPHKVELSDKPPDGGIYTVSLRGSYGSYDQHLFTSYALQEIRALGFKLLATVPLARRGSFGMGSRREVFVFQDMMITPRPQQ